MYRVLKIHRFSFIFRIYYIRVGHFQFRVGTESLKDLISFVFQVEKFVKKNKKQTKQRVLGVCWLTPEQPEAFQTKQKKDIQFPPPFLSMSLQFCYFFLFLYIVDPSILFPLSRHGGGGGSSSARQHATIKGTCLLPPLQLTRAEKQKRKGC